jgi:hypothetical protein
MSVLLTTNLRPVSGSRTARLNTEPAAPCGQPVRVLPYATCFFFGVAVGEAFFVTVLALSLAANSCFTLRAIASVSTLYVWAAARRIFPPSGCVLAESRMMDSTISFPMALSSDLRRSAASSLAADSPSFARMPRFRATISTRFSSSNGSICSAMKRRSRFIKRTGTAATMVCKTRIPVAFASASSLRCFSCAALKLASGFDGCFLG